MTINTSYSRGQEVFFIDKNKIANSKVSEISVEVNGENILSPDVTTITYKLECITNRKEDELFATRAALLSTLG